jgi:lipopolysaccharide/colanic/teichoic acid biosynthesis glycosyltransferase
VRRFYSRGLKRPLDIALCVATLPLTIPILALLALAVRVVIGSPVLFRQQRPGLMGRPFTLVKFRTMRDSIDLQGQQRPDSERIERFGRKLRAFSLDELPQIWNVLRGEMSLIGPRPLLMKYLPMYSAHQARRHEVRPGVTGWAQVNGRNEAPWEEKFKLDVWYVDHVSFLLDTRIVGLTLRKVVSREGISQPGHATAEEFKGTTLD